MAGGEERRALLIDGTFFTREVERTRQLRNISPAAVQEAERTVDYYGLDPREKDLLAVEIDFFLQKPSSKEVSERYKRDFDNAAAHLTFRGADEEFSEAGWRLRWGANVDTVNRALGEVNYLTTEALLGGRSFNLRGVIFNTAHEAILQEHGLSARPFGLYPHAQD